MNLKKVFMYHYRGIKMYFQRDQVFQIGQKKYL